MALVEGDLRSNKSTTVTMCACSSRYALASLFVACIACVARPANAKYCSNHGSTDTETNCWPFWPFCEDVEICRCYGEWWGSDCSKSPCERHDCHGHGKCSITGNYHKCECYTCSEGGHTGSCDYAGAECEYAPCLRGPETQDLTSYKDCEAMVKHGTSCMPACISGGKCSTNGRNCYMTKPGPHTCNNGRWTHDPKCQECTPEMCDHGTCIGSNEANGRTYTCDCDDGYGGENCNTEDVCEVEKPCQRDGECKNVPLTGEDNKPQQPFSCKCKPGVFGANCTSVQSVWGSQWNQPLWFLIVVNLPVAIVGVVIYWKVYRHTDIDQWIVMDGRAVAGVAAPKILLGVATTAFVSMCVLFFVTDIRSTTPEDPAWDNDVHWATLLGIVVLAFVAEAGIAYVWRSKLHCLCVVHSSATTRLLRGVLVPGLAVVSTIPVIFPYWIETQSDRSYIPLEGAWSLVSFGVIIAMFPLSMILKKVYLFPVAPHGDEDLTRNSSVDSEPIRRALEHHKVYHPDQFLQAQHAYARLAGLIPCCFWLPYMANEMHIFLDTLDVTELVRPVAGHGPTTGSVDGVRALGPVVVSLNLFTVLAILLAVIGFPAPFPEQATGAKPWSPFMLFGVAWALLVSVLLLEATYYHMWSLSEPSSSAQTRAEEAEQTANRVSFHVTLRKQTWRQKIMDKAGSWQIRTAITVLINLVAMVVYIYGLAKYDGLTSVLRLWLWIGIALSLVGTLVSLVSLALRKFPMYKIMPTDDSFRVASAVKIALVMTKTTIVFLLSSLPGETAGDKQVIDSWWATAVTTMSVVSLLFLAIITLAFDIRRVCERPELLSNAGVAKPQRFTGLYLVSFICAKLATVLFMLAGHIPGWFADCTDVDILFKTSGGDFKTIKDNYTDTFHCSSCTVVKDAKGCALPDPAIVEGPAYGCRTSCAELFFKGTNSANQSVLFFVVLPLVWIPFAVYGNNEVARLIDGVWRHRSVSSAEALGTARGRVSIGLSTTSHGYDTMIPFVHTVMISCFCIVVWLTVYHGGYNPELPTFPAFANLKDGKAAKRSLELSSRILTCAQLVLNTIMLVRTVIEIKDIIKRDRLTNSDRIDNERVCSFRRELSGSSGASLLNAHADLEPEPSPEWSPQGNHLLDTSVASRSRAASISSSEHVMGAE